VCVCAPSLIIKLRLLCWQNYNTSLNVCSNSLTNTPDHQYGPPQYGKQCPLTLSQCLLCVLLSV